MNLSFLIRAIFGLAFFQGVASYVGISLNQYRFLLEFLIVILFFTFIHFLLSRQDKSFRAPGWIWFVIFSIAVFTSALINKSDLYTTIRMYRQILWPYLFFLSILNIYLSPQSIRKINKFIVILVILQIPAAIYKYAMYGVREDVIIGTFSTQAGSMSTIFPLFIIGYLIAFYYCYKKNPLFLLLIPGLMFFAWSGGKRAFFIFMPALLFAAYIIYNLSIRQNKISILKILPNLILFITVIGIILYLGGRLNPVFNPEKERWGSFDLSYMISQARDTQMGTPETGLTQGRIASFKVAFDEIIINSSDLQRKLLGDGPDRLYLRDDHRMDYGIRYGISGAVFNLISTGLAGTLSFFFLYITFGVKAYKCIKNLQDSLYIAIAFGTILATIVFCIDFLFYSMAFFSGYILSILFFYSAAILFKQDSNKESEILTLRTLNF